MLDRSSPELRPITKRRYTMSRLTPRFISSLLALPLVFALGAPVVGISVEAAEAAQRARPRGGGRAAPPARSAPHRRPAHRLPRSEHPRSGPVPAAVVRRRHPHGPHRRPAHRLPHPAAVTAPRVPCNAVRPKRPVAEPPGRPHKRPRHPGLLERHARYRAAHRRRQRYRTVPAGPTRPGLTARRRLRRGSTGVAPVARTTEPVPRDRGNARHA